MQRQDSSLRHDGKWRAFRQRLMRQLRRMVGLADRRLPFGLRTAAGCLLLTGGAFGFLPVVGFWMVPLGLLLIALDIPPLRRRVRRWLHLPGSDAAV